MHGDRLEAETETVTNILRLIRRLAASERYEREGGVDNTSCLKSINIQWRLTEVESTWVNPAHFSYTNFQIMYSNQIKSNANVVFIEMKK